MLDSVPGFIERFAALRISVVVSSALVLLLGSAAASAKEHQSVVLLHQALEAQGGEQKLRSLKSVQWEASGYRNGLKQSERPEGPYIVEFDTVAEVHDWAGHRYRSVTDGAIYPFPKFSSGTIVERDVVMRLSGENKSPGTPLQLKIVQEREALSPERLLLTALDASDVHTEPDTTLQ